MATKPTKNKQARLSDKSLLLIRLFAGEMQAMKGRNFTDDKAVIELFQQCRPDLVARAEQIEIEG